jgi:hypothetical protein
MTNRDDEADISRIGVLFPPPANLALVNQAEQVNNAQPLIEFLTSMYVGDSPDDKEKLYVRRAIAKDQLPSIPWERLDRVVESAKLLRMREKLEVPEEQAAPGGEESPAGLGGYGGSGAEAEEPGTKEGPPGGFPGA